MTLAESTFNVTVIDEIFDLHIHTNSVRPCLDIFLAASLLEKIKIESNSHHPRMSVSSKPNPTLSNKRLSISEWLFTFRLIFGADFTLCEHFLCIAKPWNELFGQNLNEKLKVILTQFVTIISDLSQILHATMCFLQWLSRRVITRSLMLGRPKNRAIIRFANDENCTMTCSNHCWG